LLCVFITPLVRKLAFKVGAVDYPGKRKVHAKAIPKLGGLSIYFAIVGSLIFTQLFYGGIFTDKTLTILIGSTLIVGLGLLDDIYNLQAPTKLIGQIIISAIVVFLGLSIGGIQNPLTNHFISLGVWDKPLSILWLLIFMNTMNLIDGLDGLAAGITLISSLAFLVISVILHQLNSVYILLAISGACLGFLRFNFNPASIFMGDTGSLLLGFLLGIASIEGLLKSSAVISLALPTLCLFIPLIDTLLAIIRRTKKGVHIFRADAEHIHHKLMAKGLSHRNSVLAMYSATFILSILAILLSLTQGIYSLILGVVIIYVIASSLKKLKGYFLHTNEG